MRKLITLAIFLFFAIAGFSQTNVSQLLCDNLSNPIGIGVSNPTFSWQLKSDKRNVIQAAYEIRVSNDLSHLKKRKSLEWNSGKILSDESVHVIYKGNALQSAKKYFWQVRVWDNYGKASGWSTPAFFQMALLNETDWKAKWIEPGFEDIVGQPSPMFRKQFSSDKKIKSAAVFITAHGLYEAHINGRRVGEDYFTPGWTS